MKKLLLALFALASLNVVAEIDSEIPYSFASSKFSNRSNNQDETIRFYERMQD